MHSGNNETNDRFIIIAMMATKLYFTVAPVTLLGDKTTPTEGTLETQDCILNRNQSNNVVESGMAVILGDIEEINKGAFVHSHIANLINASENVSQLRYKADLTQGNTIKATKKRPQCMITKMMYVGDIEFIHNGTLRVGLL